MSLAQILSAYLNLNLLILIGFAGLALFSMILRFAGRRFSSNRELKLQYCVLMAVLGLSAIHPLLPRQEVFTPAAKVWSAPSLKSFADAYGSTQRGGYLIFLTPAGTSTLQADRFATIWSSLAVLLIFMGGIFILREIRVLLKLSRSSFLIRRLGRVRICVNDDIRVPLSYWSPGRANVVIPSAFLEDREKYQIAVAHEIQHHRHGDTQWVFVLWGLKLVCIINPVIHIWNRWISEIQEFACDETLVDQGRVESQAYARCLVEVAQTAADQRSVPVGATGLMFLIERKLLHRRIERMLSKSSNQVGRSIGVAVGLVLVLVMGATSYASNSLVQDRRVNMAQARAMALRAQSRVGFPVVVNDLVLKQLNRYIGTPEGREFMRDSLARMENYKQVVGDHLVKYGVPVEIMALPIVESGYQNLPQRVDVSMKSAGLWQFIPETARNYGLKVDRRVDERLDVALLTDAAMRYLKSNNLRFKDWQLSLLAYNMGENAVQKGMDALNTRDAWTLIRAGYEGDSDYLAKFMAAVLIMQNPDSVQ
jgi:membrane-bound lytic murein transglycosylase D